MFYGVCACGSFDDDSTDRLVQDWGCRVSGLLQGLGFKDSESQKAESLATKHEELGYTLRVRQPAIRQLPQRLCKGDKETSGEVHDGGANIIPGMKGCLRIRLLLLLLLLLLLPRLPLPLLLLLLLILLLLLVLLRLLLLLPLLLHCYDDDEDDDDDDDDDYSSSSSCCCRCHERPYCFSDVSFTGRVPITWMESGLGVKAFG